MQSRPRADYFSDRATTVATDCWARWRYGRGSLLVRDEYSTVKFARSPFIATRKRVARTFVCTVFAFLAPFHCSTAIKSPFLGYTPASSKFLPSSHRHFPSISRRFSSTKGGVHTSLCETASGSRTFTNVTGDNSVISFFNGL